MPQDNDIKYTDLPELEVSALEDEGTPVQPITDTGQIGPVEESEGIQVDPLTSPQTIDDEQRKINEQREKSFFTEVDPNDLPPLDTSEEVLLAADEDEKINLTSAYELNRDKLKMMDNITEETPEEKEWREFYKGAFSDQELSLLSGIFGAGAGIARVPEMIQSGLFEVIGKPLIWLGSKITGEEYSDEEVAKVRQAYLNQDMPGLPTGATSKIADFLQDKQKFTDSIIKKYDKGVVESFVDGNIADGFSQMTNATLQSVPYIAMSYATAGSGTLATMGSIGTVAAGQRYNELEGTDISEGARLLNSGLYGGVEGTFELVTAGIINRVRQSMGGASKDVLKEASEGMAKSFINWMGMSGKEGASEAGTDMSQQLVDIMTGVKEVKDFDIYQSLDAGAIGTFSGAGMASPSLVLNNYKRNSLNVTGKLLCSPEQAKEYRRNNSKMLDLQSQFQKFNGRSTPTSEAIKKQIEGYKQANDDIVNGNMELAQKLTADESENLRGLGRAFRDVTNQIEAYKESGENYKPLLEIKNKIAEDMQNIRKEAEGRQDPVDPEIIEAIKEGTKPSYRIGEKTFETKEEFLKEAEQYRGQKEGVPDIEVRNDEDTQKSLTAVLEEGLSSYKIDQQTFDSKEEFIKALQEKKGQDVDFNVENDEGTLQEALNIVTPQPAKIGTLENKNVNYDGIEGRLVKKDDGYYVVDKDGNETFVEGGESGRPMEDLGITETEKVPTYNPKDSSIEYQGNNFTYESANVDADGNTTSINVVDADGNKQTIDDKFAVEDIEYQKILSELDQAGNIETITEEDIDSEAKNVKAETHEQAGTTAEATQVQEGRPGEDTTQLTEEEVRERQEAIDEDTKAKIKDIKDARAKVEKTQNLIAEEQAKDNVDSFRVNKLNKDLTKAEKNLNALETEAKDLGITEEIIETEDFGEKPKPKEPTPKEPAPKETKPKAKEVKVEDQDIKLEEKREAKPALKRILDTKEEGVFQHDITKDGEDIGDAVIQEEGDVWKIKNINLDQEQQGKGLGKATYRQMNKLANADGKVLHSNEVGKTNKEAKRVWESLVKDGEAVKNDDGTYQFKKPEKAKPKVELETKHKDPIKFDKKKAASIAEKIRAKKIKGVLGAGPYIPIVNGALEVAATTVEAGGSIAEALNKGIANIRASEAYKKLGRKERREADDLFYEHMAEFVGEDTAVTEKKPAETKKDKPVKKEQTIKEEITTDKATDSYKEAEKNMADMKGNKVKKLDYNLDPMKFMDRVRRALSNAYARVNQLQDKITESGGTITDGMNVREKITLYPGKVDAKVNKMTSDVLTGENSILKRAKKDGVDLDDLGLFMMAQHAPERNAVMKAEQNVDNGSGMSDKQASEIIESIKERGDLSKFEKYANEFRKRVIKDGIQKELMGSGLENKSTFDFLNDRYKYYVPLKVKSEALGEKKAARSRTDKGKGFDVRGENIIKAKGSKKFDYTQRNNPIVQSLFDYQTSARKGGRNEVAQSLYELVKANPNKDIFSIKRDATDQRIDENGELVVSFGQFKDIDADNVVKARINGENYSIEIKDPDLLRAITGSGMAQGGVGVQKAVAVMNKFNNYFRSIFTTFNPEFMVNNFFRDIQTAGINMSTLDANKAKRTLAKNVFPAMDGIRRFNFDGKENSWSKLAEEYIDEGGQAGWVQAGNIDEFATDFAKSIKRYKSDRTSDKFMNVLNSMGEFVNKSNNVVELGTRLAAYKFAKDQGLSKQQSAVFAKELTVDFNKKGEWGSAINSLYLFANTGLVSSARLIRTLNTKKGRRLVSTIPVMAFMVNMLNAYNNEDEWDKVTDEEKSRSLIFMMPGGGKINVPLPWGFNVFKVAGDEAYNIVNGKKDTMSSLKNVLMSVNSAFNPVSSATLSQMLSPTMTDPFVQISENKTFMGTPIAPEQPPFGQKKKESSRFFSSVSKPSKYITGVLNDITGGDEVKAGYIDINPEYVDHLFNSFTGGTGKFVGNTFNTSSRLIEGEEIIPSKVPILRTVYKEKSEFRDTKVIYETIEKSYTKDISDSDESKFFKSIKSALKEKKITEEQVDKFKKQYKENRQILKLGEKFPDLSYKERKDRIKGKKKKSKKRYL